MLHITENACKGELNKIGKFVDTTLLFSFAQSK